MLSISSVLYSYTAFLNLIIFGGLAYLAWRFWHDYRDGPTRPVLWLFLFFLSFANERMGLVISSIQAMLDISRAPSFLVWRILSLLAVIVAFIGLMIGMRNETTEADGNG